MDKYEFDDEIKELAQNIETTQSIESTELIGEPSREVKEKLRLQSLTVGRKMEHKVGEIVGEPSIEQKIKLKYYKQQIIGGDQTIGEYPEEKSQKDKEAERKAIKREQRLRKLSEEIDILCGYGVKQ